MASRSAAALAAKHICLTCVDWFPESQFEFKSGRWLHTVKGSKHYNDMRNNRSSNSRNTKQGDSIMAARKTSTKSAATSKEAPSDEFRAFLLELNQLTSKYLGDAAVQKAAQSVAKSDEPEDEDDGDEGTTSHTEAELKKKSVAALRKIAIEEGFDPDEVEEASKQELIAGILDDDEDDDDADSEDAEDEDDESEDEDDDEEGDDEDAELRAELEAMTLAKLRKEARDEYGATGAELKGLDKDAIIDLILDADEEDDSDVDVDEDQDDEDGYTEDELKAMDLDELKEILDEWEVDYSAKARKATLVKLVLEAQDEEEYED